MELRNATKYVRKCLGVAQEAPLSLGRPHKAQGDLGELRKASGSYGTAHACTRNIIKIYQCKIDF